MLGYDGHIHMLIGIDTAARLTGVIMDLNNEPYGYFSIDRPPFAAQFKGKSIRDPFVPGRDVDAISRATISERAAALTIRESARIVAAAVLPRPHPPRAEGALQQLESFARCRSCESRSSCGVRPQFTVGVRPRRG